MLSILLLLAAMMSCNSQESSGDSESTENATTAIENPPAPGFRAEASDPKAIALADSVMKAMGGRKAWDDMRFVSWNFFGVRDLVWDKQTGRVRIEEPARNETFLININDNTGQVFVGDSLISPADSLMDRVQMGKNIWINDSYWLFMPFKLKDSGVALTYIGQDTLSTGEPAEVIELTFENVGVTPNNKYRVYIDPEDYLVRQWAYYRNSDQDSASAIWPWDNYALYSGLMLSADRSDNRGPKNVRVYDSLPDGIFEDPAYNMSSLIISDED